MRAAALVCLAGCAYKPGSFATFAGERFAGQQVTVGCLDLAIERRADHSPREPVIAYAFGNRCARAAVVDLAAARVVGRTGDGHEVALAPFDPLGEIRPLRIDGRWTGKEALAYPAGESLALVCVDAASVAHAPEPRWVCFASPSLEAAR